MKTIKVISIFLFLGFLRLPQAAACAVCFGQVDTPMTRALNWGIIVMFGALILVFTGVGAFIWQMNDKSRRIQSEKLETKTC